MVVRPALIFSSAVSPDHLRSECMHNDNPIITTYLATITEDDYPAFRALAHIEFPQTYGEWLDLLDKHIGYYQKVGHEVVLVPVKPDEFARFCDEKKKSAYNLNSLSIFAQRKGQRRQGNGQSGASART